MVSLMTFPHRLLKGLFAGALLLFWTLALAQPCKDTATVQPSTTANAFTSTTTMQNCYVPGASDTVTFTISPNQANLDAPKAVVVFDIVSTDNPNSPSRILQVIDVFSLGITPDIFRQPIDMVMVEAGLQGELSFNMQETAPPGNYSMVISIFRLPDDLRPQDVTYDINALAGRVFYDFRVEE
jgi:hypothetical protein